MVILQKHKKIKQEISVNNKKNKMGNFSTKRLKKTIILRLYYEMILRKGNYMSRVTGNNNIST